MAPRYGLRSLLAAPRPRELMGSASGKALEISAALRTTRARKGLSGTTRGKRVGETSLLERGTEPRAATPPPANSLLLDVDEEEGARDQT